MKPTAIAISAYDEALKAMSAATDAEDKTEKAAIAPAPLAPAREVYGEMQYERGMVKEALTAFEATKAKEPNRLRGYAGAAKAAEKLGDRVAAKTNYEKLVKLVGQPQSDRAEVKAAYQFLGKRGDKGTRESSPKEKSDAVSGRAGFFNQTVQSRS